MLALIGNQHPSVTISIVRDDNTKLLLKKSSIQQLANGL